MGSNALSYSLQHQFEQEVLSTDGPEDDEYVRVMRMGFRVGAIAYVLQTDATVFWDEVQRLAKALVKSTPQAELSRAIINNHRTT